VRSLPSTFLDRGRWKEAEKLEVRVMETSVRVLSEEYPDTLTSMNNLTFTLQGQGRDDNTIRLVNEYVRLPMYILGADYSFISSLISVDYFFTFSKKPNLRIGISAFCPITPTLLYYIAVTWV
jgi:hypothetical protein